MRLFDRTRHKVTLTKAGEAMLPEAYRLNIGCVSSALFDVLPPILNRLHTQHPEIALSLAEHESAAAALAVIQGSLDLAFIRVQRLSLIHI